MEHVKSQGILFIHTIQTYLLYPYYLQELCQGLGTYNEAGKLLPSRGLQSQGKDGFKTILVI